MGQLADNLAAVQRRIDQACAAAERDPAEVRLLAVSKTHPVSVLAEAYEAGVRLFGENRVQELVDKAAQLDRPDLTWALLGHLQSNKVKPAAELAGEFHALDSLKVAEALDRRLQQLGRGLDVFVQVNSSGEPQKSGIPPSEVEAFGRGLSTYASLRVRGLMTLAVFSDDETAVAACFARTLDLRDRYGDLIGTELSMGMSGDFPLAIAHGATTVRVGQAIFGPRVPSP